MLKFPDFDPAFPAQSWVLPRVLEHQADRLGDRPFLKWQDDGPEYTFAETNRRANQLARGFSSLGVGRGDCVVLFMPNSLDYLFAWFALNKIGAVEVPINTAYRGSFLQHQVNISRARTIVADVELLDAVRASIAQMPAVERIVVWSRDGRVPKPCPAIGTCEVVVFADVVAADGSNVDAAVEPQDIGAIMFTSGTTGLSKGVMMPHAQLYLFAEIDVQALKIGADDVYMTMMPLFHANAQLLTVYPCLIAGARCVLYERFSATEWVRRLNSSGATVTNSLGVMLPFVFAQPPSSGDRSHRLTRILCAPTPYEILDPFRERFGVEQFIEGFGQTEICCPMMTPLAMQRERPKGAAGLLLDQWFEVRIVDPETDEEVLDGQVGELVVRHRRPWTINAGYVSMPDRTAEAWRNLWFHTGDGMRRDADGWFYFVDRLKDALRRRGENISSFEVEAPIREHPAVTDVAVVAVAAEQGGEDDVKACVVLHPGISLTPEELLEWCEPRLPAFAMPRYIEFVDSFPRTPNEKIQKGVLRAAGVTAKTWDRVRAGYRLKGERGRSGR